MNLSSRVQAHKSDGYAAIVELAGTEEQADYIILAGLGFLSLICLAFALKNIAKMFFGFLSVVVSLIFAALAFANFKATYERRFVSGAELQQATLETAQRAVQNATLVYQWMSKFGVV